MGQFVDINDMPWLDVSLYINNETLLFDRLQTWKYIAFLSHTRFYLLCQLKPSSLFLL